ncbi:hypothetical protein GCM10008983_27040 [Lentibacillus halophilus]|uniref:YcxB-like C-terminal domain-containing protein n=1 Tax=Lentibacillus halophilus TaxID=295065 RepID=A0ABN0ZH55_9BACI
MTIHYQLVYDDVLALQRDVIQHSNTHHIKRMYTKWITAILLFLAILYLFQLSWLSAAVSAVITVIYFFTFPALYAKVALSRANSRMQKQDYSHILGPTEMTFSEDGIKRDINGTITYFTWEQFMKRGEDSNHYFLYESDLQGLILPKRPSDKHPEDVAAYQAYIQTHVHLPD